MAEQRTWSEHEIRDLIGIEVSTGQTMHVLNAPISGAELNAAVRDIAATAFAVFKTQASQIGSSTLYRWKWGNPGKWEINQINGFLVNGKSHNEMGNSIFKWDFPFINGFPHFFIEFSISQNPFI